MSWKELDLVKLEAEAFLLGQWKNFAEIEEALTLQELEAILEASREQRNEQNKFLAAIQGVDLDKANGESVQDRFDAVKRRAEAKLSGRSEIELEYAEFGLDMDFD